MEPEVKTQIQCPFCGEKIDAVAFYCPICGKKIREKPLSSSFWAQLGLYLLSLLLPPFGLGLTWRYFRSKDPKLKKIGLVSLIMTILALIVVTWITVWYTQHLYDQVNQEMNKYQNLGI